MKKFDHFDFEELTHEEDNLKNQLSANQFKEEQISTPEQSTVESILSYSKALSVRKTESLGYIEQLIN